MAPLRLYISAFLAATAGLVAALPLPNPIAEDTTYHTQDFLTALRHHRGLTRPDDHDFHFFGPGPVLDDKPGAPEKELDPLRSKDAHDLWGTAHLARDLPARDEAA